MAYNKAKAEKEWLRWKEVEEKKLRELGVDEETIQRLHTYDWAQFNKERQYLQRQVDWSPYVDWVSAQDLELPVEDTFTSLIVCDECGTNFCRRIAKNQRVLWTCRKHFKGKHLCSMESLNETEIQQCFLTLYKKLAENRQEILGSYLRQLEELKDKDFMAHPDAMELNRQIAGLLEQNHTLHRLRAKECIDSAFFIAQSNELSQKISNLKAELKQYRDLNEYADFIDNTRLILTILDSPMPVFSSSVFRNIVSRITVTHETLRFQLVNGLELEEERISGG